MKNKPTLILLAIGVVIALAGCDFGGISTASEVEEIGDEAVDEAAPEVIGLANPASVYCEDQGYTLEIREDADGGQYGVCIFPDGSECEEWAFFNGECAPGAAEDTEQAEPVIDRTDLVSFQSALVDALSAPERDYAYLQTFMGESFEIMIWWGNAEQMSPGDAALALQNTFLPPANQIGFALDADIATLIGSNPYELYPAGVGFLLSQGWGASEGDEALLVYGQDASGNYYWASILYANDGFASAPLPAAEEAWHPPAGDMCATLQADVMANLGAGEASLDTNASFVDFAEQTEGTGCVITVTGTGADFAAFEEGFFGIYVQLQAMLEGQGWVEDMMYGLGGPTGIGSGFRRDNALLILIAGWEPSDDAECPTDQPIGMCELTPEQQIYEITLNVAEQ